MSVKILTLVSSMFFPVLAIASSAQAAEPQFADAETYFSTDAGRALLPAGFHAAEAKLDAQFAAVCVDSFCEGVVPNWVPLGLNCSVDQVSGTVGECSWSFAGSFEEVDALTGKVTVFHENRTCDLGFQGNARQLAEFLTAAGEAKGFAFGFVMTAVPGRADGATLFDLLNACL